MNDTRLAVDLGTTWTAAATSAAAMPAGVVDLGERGAAMPSVIAVGDGGFVVGSAAERLIALRPDCGAREVKRRFGDTTPIVLSGRPYGPEALTTELLRSVAATAGVDTASTAVTLTHPANWGEYKLDLLRNVGTAAGFATTTLVSEPAAAAKHYAATGRLAIGDTVAVYDFGGGTFDAAIITLTAQGPRLLGTPHGIERLGGIDLDQVVFGHVVASLGGILDDLDRTDPDVRRALTRLRTACTLAKEQLSADGEATVEVVAPGVSTQIRVTRDELESALRPRLAETTAALDRTLASAGITAGDLAGVVLVGGSSRIPLVAEVVESHTGRPALDDGDVKLVVVQGALVGDAPAPAPAPAPIVLTTFPAPTLAPSTETTTMSDQPQPSPTSAGTGGRTPPPPPPKRGPSTAAKLAGGAAAAAAAVAGAAILDDDVADALGFGDDDSPTPPAPAAFAGEAARQNDDPGVDDTPPADADDESMDAFDAAEAPLANVLTSTQTAQFAAPQPAQAVPQFSAPQFDEPDPAPRQQSAPRPQQPDLPDRPDVDDDFESARAQLLERLDDFEAPPGTSPEDAAELKAELQGVIERFHPAPGQSTEDALAMLRDQYDQHVQDFTQDQKIDALIEEAQRDNEDDDADHTGDDPIVDPPLDGADDDGDGGDDGPVTLPASVLDAVLEVSEPIVIVDPLPTPDPAPTGGFGSVLSSLNDDFDAILESNDPPLQQADVADLGEVVEQIQSADPLGLPAQFEPVQFEPAQFEAQPFEGGDLGEQVDPAFDVAPAIEVDATLDPAPAFDAPDVVAEVPEVVIDTFDAPDSPADAADDAVGFAEDIAGDVTPNNFDNLDFG